MAFHISLSSAYFILRCSFESSAAYQVETDLHEIETDLFLHFLVDNGYHNSHTVKGLISFYCMGIIICVTNQGKCHLPAIKRGIISSSDIAETAVITCSKLIIETLEQGVKYVQS